MDKITEKKIADGYDRIADRIKMRGSFYDDCLSLYGGGKEDNILDIACGQGLLLQRLRARFPAVKMTGVDLSPRLCKIAQENNPEATIFQANAESLPFSDETFEVVFMTEALEHMLAVEDVISEVHRVLKPGGTFIVTVPNRDWLDYDRFEDDHEVFQPVDDHFFSFRELSDILRRGGFSIERYRGSGALFGQRAHSYERVLAAIFPPLRRKMKRLMCRCRRAL